MASSSKHPPCMAVSKLSGWVQNGERWDLWWNGRSVANVVPHPVLGFRLCLDARRAAPGKVVAVASARQARRYAERWCAARLCPQLQLRDAVALLVDGTRGTHSVVPPGLTREQRQQARRLAEAGAGELRRIKEALAPQRLPMAVRPDVQENRRAWSATGQAPLTRPLGGRVTPKAPRARSLPRR
ncbi:hypothetical protein [Stenotrophomonas maltophilia]|uniref:hypothetical protein n=1 Tax=Stenotrophomonas maltophilia TaxID=40324 RepID=UPI0015EB3DA6